MPEEHEVLWRVTVVVRNAAPIVALVTDHHTKILTGMINSYDDESEVYIEGQTDTGGIVHLHIRKSDVIAWLAVEHSRVARAVVGIIKPQ